MPKIMLMLLLLFISLDVSVASTEDTQSPVPVYSEPIEENAEDKETCANKWDQYHKSQECFAPYQNVNGTMKPGAFEHCTDIKYPTECPLR
jgi:hypothetical protein